MILLTELPQYTIDPYTKESLDNAHSSTRGEDLPEVEQKSAFQRRKWIWKSRWWCDDTNNYNFKDGKINNISWTNKKCIQKESQGRKYDKKLGRHSRLPF